MGLPIITYTNNFHVCSTVYVEVGNPPGIVNQLNCHYRSALFKLNKQKTHLIYSWVMQNWLRNEHNDSNLFIFTVYMNCYIG